MALQLNVKIEKSEGMDYIFGNLSTIYYPVLWFDASVELPRGMVGAIHLLLNIPSIMVGASIIGVIMGLIGIVLVYRTITQGKSELHKPCVDQQNNKNNKVVEKLNYIRNIISFENKNKMKDVESTEK